MLFLIHGNVFIKTCAAPPRYRCVDANGAKIANRLKYSGEHITQNLFQIDVRFYTTYPGAIFFPVIHTVIDKTFCVIGRRMADNKYIHHKYTRAAFQDGPLLALA